MLYALAVALHPEGVDRNAAHWSPDKRYSRVALHPEGVDRNCDYHFNTGSRDWSPSTRRAWIEILPTGQQARTASVALHPEGVDRNKYVAVPELHKDGVALHPEGVDRNAIPDILRHGVFESPSTRRAWIEMPTRAQH